jgi:hypothetical protein
MTITKSAFDTPLTQILRPLMIQPPRARSARVFMLAGSPPPLGSEIAMADRASPRA